MKPCHSIQNILLLLSLILILGKSQAAALEAPRITLQELKSILDQKTDVIIVDARGKNSFEQEHIKGAISIPVEEVEARVDELPKDKEIVFYCT
ncbi:MAG: rhodanese-like domain-containing protein [bacterium]